MGVYLGMVEGDVFVGGVFNDNVNDVVRGVTNTSRTR